MRKSLIATLTAAVLLMPAAMAARAGASEEESNDERPAMVFGSIEGVAGMRHVYIQKLGKVYVGRFNRPKTQLLEGGAFYFDDVPPGEYYLAGFSRNNELFWFRYTKESVQEVLFTVEPGGLHFMGSYRVSDVSKSGFFSKKGSFDIEAVDAPGEAELLDRIAPEAEGTEWAARIRSRRKSVEAASTE